jgi:hypothetical protein
LETLEVQQDRRRNDIVTIDESWFQLSTDHESIWPPSGEQVPERERHMIQSKKFMVTILWNPSRLLLVTVFPTARKSNSDSCFTHRISPNSDWRSTEGGKGERKFIIHADDARTHTPHGRTNS